MSPNLNHSPSSENLSSSPSAEGLSLSPSLSPSANGRRTEGRDVRILEFCVCVASALLATVIMFQI